MLFIAAHNAIGFGGQRTFQNHFVVGIPRCAGRTFHRKYQFGSLDQGGYPFHAFPDGIIQTKFFNGFEIFREQGRADHSYAPALRPRRQAVQRCPPPKTGAGHDIGVENNFHAWPRRRTRCTAAATAASSFAAIKGRPRPPSSSDRTLAGVRD